MLDIRQRIKAQKPVVAKVDGGVLGEVLMRPLTTGEVIEMHARIAAAKLEGTWAELERRFNVELLVLVICDASGKLELTDEDVPALLGLPFQTITRLSEHAMEICGLSQKAQETMAAK